MKNITWPQTTVIVAFLAAVVYLASIGRDTAALIAVGTMLLGGLGLSIGQIQGVRENTNGTASRMLSMIEKLQETLAVLPAVPTTAQSPEEKEPLSTEPRTPVD